MIKKIFQLSILLVVTGYCVYSSVNHFILAVNTQSHDEGVRKFEARLKILRDLIPLNRGVIGYVSNENIGSADYDPANASGEYVLSQYALSPLVLDKNEYHEWDILNMTSDAYKLWAKEHGDEFKVVGSGGGFYLVQRLTK